MESKIAQHPSVDELVAFANGRLSDEIVEVIADHVDGCSDCRKVLENTDDDHLGRLARNAIRNVERSDTVLDQGSDTHPNERNDVLAAEVTQQLAGHPRYRILNHLGSGGMGEVFKAEHRMMQRPVALKIIRNELTKHSDAVSRFRNEVQTAASLTHPNIVTVHDADEFGGVHFLVMEFVEGKTLYERVATNGPLDAEEAADIIRQVSNGLQHAHEQGMVHRDIKPHNLIITADGTVKILDFGLARFAMNVDPQSQFSESVGLTAANLTLGTPDFIAPEQANDARSADIRSDIYSLGCTFYFCLTGQTPFPSGSSLEKISSHMLLEPTSIATIRNDVDESIVAALEKMMRKDPAERFQSPQEVSSALDAIQTRLQTVESKEIKSSLRPTDKRSLKRTWLLIATLIAAFVGPSVFMFLKRANEPGENIDLRSSVDAASNDGENPNENDDPRETDAVPINGQAFSALFLLPSRVWFDDYDPVRRILEKQGVKVVTASNSRRISAAEGSFGRPFECDFLLSEISPHDQFDVIIIAGGEIDRLVGDGADARAAKKLVDRMQRNEKLVAGICLGVSVLADANLLNGKQVAYNQFVEDDFPSSGAIFKYKPVVVDGRLITADEPDAAVEFARAIAAALGRSP